MRNLSAAATAALLVMSAPAHADKLFAVTPSGATEMLFSEPPQEVVGKLSSHCMDLKWSVTSSTSSEVVCEAPLNFGQSLAGTIMMGNSYSTPPRRFFRFNVAEVNGISRVQAAGWMELQMAFGQTRRTDFSGPEFHNGMMNFMGGAGGKLPYGTSFPNHAFVGFDSDTITQGKYQLPRIAQIYPDSPGAKAGLEVGDVITSVAGKTIKNVDADWLDAMASATKTASYEVDFYRDGKQQKVMVERAYRPTWTEQVTAAAPAPAVTAPVATASTPSVADEIAKLAKLRDSGTLTQAEFDTQKKKLLGQ